MGLVKGEAKVTIRRARSCLYSRSASFFRIWTCDLRGFAVLATGGGRGGGTPLAVARREGSLGRNERRRRHRRPYRCSDNVGRVGRAAFGNSGQAGRSRSLWFSSFLAPRPTAWPALPGLQES